MECPALVAWEIYHQDLWSVGDEMRLLGPKCQLYYAKCSKLIHILQKIVEVIWHIASGLMLPSVKSLRAYFQPITAQYPELLTNEKTVFCPLGSPSGSKCKWSRR